MKLKEIKPNSGEYYCGVGNKGYIFNSRNNFLTVLHVHNGILQTDFYNYIERFPDKLEDLDWKPNFKHVTFDENQGEKVIPVFYTEETYKSCWYCTFFCRDCWSCKYHEKFIKTKSEMHRGCAYRKPRG